MASPQGPMANRWSGCAAQGMRRLHSLIGQRHLSSNPSRHVCGGNERMVNIVGFAGISAALGCAWWFLSNESVHDATNRNPREEQSCLELGTVCATPRKYFNTALVNLVAHRFPHRITKQGCCRLHKPNLQGSSSYRVMR